MKKIVYITALIGMLGTILLAFQKKSKEEFSLRYTVLEKWNLPDELREVSGITWVGQDRVACVQDEDGIIFIFNLRTSRVEDRIRFGDKGDFEGLAKMGEDAFVLRSDGILYEVRNFLGETPAVEQYRTAASGLPGVNLEGLCADPERNRLLLAIKEQGRKTGQKEVFPFDLEAKQGSDQPLFVIDLSHPILERIEGKRNNKFSPGEIGIHPVTGEYYVLDGTRPKILITDPTGKPRELFLLRIADFENPEGLTFNPRGELFISNEAEGGPANILKVALDRK